MKKKTRKVKPSAKGKGKLIIKGKGQGKKTKAPKERTERVKRKVLQESNDTSLSDMGTYDLCQDD